MTPIKDLVDAAEAVLEIDATFKHLKQLRSALDAMPPIDALEAAWEFAMAHVSRVNRVRQGVESYSLDADCAYKEMNFRHLLKADKLYTEDLKNASE